MGKNADLSTLVHETGHIFEEELRRIVASGMADERQISDLGVLDKWLSRFDDDAELKKEYGALRMKDLYGGRSFDKLGAAQKEDARSRAKREYFARGFELYVREGKAPSEEMRGVFERFKRWLLAIYRHAKNLGVEINDDVRGVFDRMLATEQEMDETSALNELAALQAAELDKLHVTGADRQYMSGLLDIAKQKAVAAVERERNRERQARTRQYAVEAREELLKDRVYAAMAEMRKPRKRLNVALLISMVGEEAVDILRKKGFGKTALERKNHGQDPNLFAWKYGFNDAAHMLAEIAASESMSKRIAEIVAAREAQHDATVDPAPPLLRQAEVGEAMRMTGKYLATAIGRPGISNSAIKEVARKKLAAMPLREAGGHLPFQAAMRRALQRERSAFSRGDFAAALEANTQARLNLEFARQALDVADMVAKFGKEAKRFAGQKSADPVARHAVNRLAARYGLVPFDEALAGGKSLDSISEWYKERIEEGYMLDFSADMFVKNNVPWKDETFEDFADVADEVARIIVVERHARQLLVKGRKEEFKAAIEELNAGILSFYSPKRVKLIDKDGIFHKALRTIAAYHSKMENLCKILDGGESLGPVWNALYRPVTMAEDKRGIYFKALKERLRGPEVFGLYSETELIEMGRVKEHVASLGESITKGQRIMFALNLGNKGNRLRIEKGFGYSERQIADVIQTLTERDWKFIVAVWQTFEQYKVEAFAMHERVTGTRPTEVEATPFTVRTADGKQITVPGGYFPILYDKGQADPKLAEQLDKMPEAFAAATRKGHLKERTKTGAGSPLRLDMTGIARALDDVITDICFREALIDVGRILRDKSFRHTVESTLGREYYDVIVSWFKDAARSNFAPEPGQSIARWARSSATMMGMGFKVTTMLAQPLGLTQSAEQIGMAAVAEGINLAYGKGIDAAQEAIAEMRQLSSMMDSRMQSYDRDVYDATSAFAGQQLTPTGMLDAVTPARIRAMEKWVKEHAFIPMAGVQFYAVDVPTWLGAFNKYLREHEGDADLRTKAGEYADHIVRITQGTGFNKDLSKIQRGSEYLKLFTMFYSYFNTLFGLLQLRTADVKLHQDKAAAMRAANSFLMLVAVPALLSEWLVGRGPDEDEAYWKWAARQLVMYPAQTIIGVRDVTQFVDPKYGYQASPAQDAPASVYNTLAETLRAVADPDKFSAKKLGFQALRTFGYLKGLPLRQPEITLKNVIDYADGTTPDFELRDLAFSRQRSRR